MKKVFLTILVLASLNSFSNPKVLGLKKSYLPDTTLVPQILNLQLANYIGKPVDSLFLVLPSGFSYRQFIPTGIGYCRGVFQSYGESESNLVCVEIFIDNFQLMSFPNRTQTTTWNMNLAKQEIISYIRVLKNNLCIYGCNNPNYY